MSAFVKKLNLELVLCNLLLIEFTLSDSFNNHLSSVGSMFGVEESIVDV